MQKQRVFVRAIEHVMSNRPRCSGKGGIYVSSNYDSNITFSFGACINRKYWHILYMENRTIKVRSFRASMAVADGGEMLILHMC